MISTKKARLKKRLIRVASLIVVLFLLLQGIKGVVPYVLVSMATQANHAKVEVREFKLSFFPLSVFISDLEVAHPSLALKNRFSIEEAFIKINFLELLEKRIHIDTIQIKGFKPLSDRKQSGFLKHIKKPSKTSTGFLKGISIKLPTVSFDITKTETAKKVERLNQQLSNFDSNVSKQLKEDKKRLEAELALLKNQFEALQKKPFSLQSISDINALTETFNKVQTEISRSESSYKHKLDQISSQFNAIEKESNQRLQNALKLLNNPSHGLNERVPSMIRFAGIGLINGLKKAFQIKQDLNTFQLPKSKSRLAKGRVLTSTKQASFFIQDFLLQGEGFNQIIKLQATNIASKHENNQLLLDATLQLTQQDEPKRLISMDLKEKSLSVFDVFCSAEHWLLDLSDLTQGSVSYLGGKRFKVNVAFKPESDWIDLDSSFYVSEVGIKDQDWLSPYIKRAPVKLKLFIKGSLEDPTIRYKSNIDVLLSFFVEQVIRDDIKKQTKAIHKQYASQMSQWRGQFFSKKGKSASFLQNEFSDLNSLKTQLSKEFSIDSLF